MKHHLITTLGLATALALTACGAETGSDASDNGPTSAVAPSASVQTDSAPSGSATDSDSDSDEHNDADVTFAQMMIPHHRQAVEMSELVLAEDGISPEVTELATRIADAQAPEVETMTG